MPELCFGSWHVADLTQLAVGMLVLSCHLQGSELKKTGGGGDDEEEEEDEEEDEDEEDDGKDLPEGKTGSKVMTRRQKAIAEGKS